MHMDNIDPTTGEVIPPGEVLIGAVQTSPTLAKLATALAIAQGQIAAAAKDSENPHFKTRYADLASIWEACRKPLSSNGIAVPQIPTSSSPNEVSVHTILMHNSGEWIAGTLTMKPAQNTPQGIGSCITYARRYALASMVGVAPDDDDGNAASSPPARQGQRPPQQQAQRQQPSPDAPPPAQAAPTSAPPPPAPSAPAAAPSAPTAELPGLRAKRLFDSWVSNGFPREDLEGFLSARGVKIGGNVDKATLDLWEAELTKRLQARASVAPPQPASVPPQQGQEDVVF